MRKTIVEESGRKGYNARLVRQTNRLMALKLIATQKEISRAELAVRLNLTKAASGNIVADLIREGLICEEEAVESDNGTTLGRRPIRLKLSEQAPCVLGVLIKRGILYVTLAEMSGKILDRTEYVYEEDINEDKLLDILTGQYDLIRDRSDRRILAIGISSVGPIDAERGCILNPPNFYGMKNIPICEKLRQHAQLPCFIINDSNSGALAEKLYGRAKENGDFIYLHIMNGIGSGCVLGNRIYTGVLGQCGEIGHTSINAWGPKCACGNAGCLELYANLKNMNAKMRSMNRIYAGQVPDDSRNSMEALYADRDAEFGEMLEAAEKGNLSAVAAVEEFAEYLSVALINMINILNVNTVIVGYDNNKNTVILENILKTKINERTLIAPNCQVEVEKSVFQGDAPLYGAIALITNKIFEGEISF